MVLFLSKKPTAPKPTQGYVPIDLVQRMASSGMAESDIANRLSSQGFSPAQIGVAMREALKAQVNAPMRSQPGMGFPQPMGEVNVPDTPTMEFPRPPAEMAQRQPRQMPQYEQPIQREPAPERMRAPNYPTTMASPPRRQLDIMPPQEAMTARRDIGIPPERMVSSDARTVRQTSPREQEMRARTPERTSELPSEITLEEIIEGVVADYWGEFEERLVNFDKRDVQLQSQIQDLKKAMGELEGKLKTREADMVGRLEGMGESMNNIQGRIGSMEKVFKEFVPQMSENIRTMADVVEKFKSTK